jgi:hypothetical protein
MKPIRRYSPVGFHQKPVATEMRAGWEIVLEYEKEGAGPHLMDLSHIAKFDIQNEDLSRFRPGGRMIPELPGACLLEDGCAIGRLNPTQAIIWFLSGEPAPVPTEAEYTDTTEAYALLAIAGDNAFGVMEKITSLDVAPRGKQPPFILQGPVFQIAGQILVAAKNIVLIAFSRGYARSMTEAILQSGTPLDLQPAGDRILQSFARRIT